MSYFRDELYRLRGIKNTFVFSEDAEYPKSPRIQTLDSILAIEEVIPASFYAKGDGSMFEKSALISAMRSLMIPAQISQVVEIIGTNSIPTHDSAYGRATYISGLIPTAPSGGSVGGDDGTGGGDDSTGGGANGATGGKP